MNTRILQNFGTVAMLAIVIALSLGHNAAAQAKDREGKPKLEGTWTVQVQIVDCTSGNAMGPAFPSLLTFARGGVLTEATANPHFYPADRGPGHGVWSTRDTGSYAASKAFITLNGVLQSTQVIRQTIQLTGSGDSFNSAATIQFFDPSGNLIKSGCATAVGQRFQ